MKPFKKFSLHIRSLGGQIFTLIMVITISTVVMLGITFFYLSSNIIKNNLENVLAEVVKNNALELDNLLGNAMKNALRIANDPKFQAILRNPIPGNLADIYSQELELDNQLSFIQNYVDNVFGFYIIGANGLQFKSNFSSPIYQNWQNFDWYKKIISSKEPVWFETHEGSFTVNTIGQPLITHGLRIIDKSSGNILGVLLTDIEVETFERIISQGLGESGLFILHGRDGTQIACSETSPVISKADLSYSTTIAYSGWKLEGLLYSDTILKSVLSMVKPIFLLIFIIAIVDFIAALSIVSRITTPIKDLSRLMEIVQSGNFNVNMDFRSDDEIGRLSSSFNVMVEKINTLMKDLYEEHEKLRISEMKTLEAQINPHFLYNTLESIIWLARNNQNADVVKLVFSLTRLLRIGLSRGRTLVSIEEEIEHIKNYLVIQEVRFADEFESVITIPDAVCKNKTLKLILQPIIENAIYHGIMKVEGKGEIHISADFSEKGITFRVRDNGPGMDDKTAEELRSLLAGDSQTELGFGLRNVNERIKLYFGPDYGIDFYRIGDQFTEFTIQIPRI